MSDGAIRFTAKMKGSSEVIRLLNRYPQKVETLFEQFQNHVGRLRGDTKKRLQKLAALERKFLIKALKRYKAIDPHFRTDAQRAFKEWRERLRECVEMCRNKWQSPPVLG